MSEQTYQDDGQADQKASPTRGGSRPGAGRQPRYDGRTSQLVRVMATAEELQTITTRTDPDSRRAALLDQAAGYHIAGQRFKRSIAEHRRWLASHGETYPDHIWHLVEAILTLKILKIYVDDRYYALKTRYAGEDIETAEWLAGGYVKTETP